MTHRQTKDTKAYLKTGDVIVANFSSGLTATGGNLQGTGTTIVKVNLSTANPSGPPTLFFPEPLFAGFSTALGVLSRGFVIVGQVPSTDGSGMCTEGTHGQEENVGQGSRLGYRYGKGPRRPKR